MLTPFGTVRHYHWVKLWVLRRCTRAFDARFVDYAKVGTSNVHFYLKATAITRYTAFLEFLPKIPFMSPGATQTGHRKLTALAAMLGSDSDSGPLVQNDFCPVVHSHDPGMIRLF